jgi:signal transduction histidine kinase
MQAGMSALAPDDGAAPSRLPRRLRAAHVRAVLGPVGLVVGLAAEWASQGTAGSAATVADLAVGWSLIACGLVGWRACPATPVGVLMVAAGFAWFAGNFADAAAYLHRGPLAHLLLVYPAGRLSRTARFVAGAWYLDGAVVVLAQADWLTLALCLALLAATLAALARTGRRDRRAAALAAGSAIAMTLPLIVGSALRLTGASPVVEAPVLTSFQLALVLVPPVLIGGLLRRFREPATAVVVELGEASGSGTVRDALARALGDPSLAVGYRLPGTGAYVDEEGPELRLPSPGDARRVTAMGDAVVVHDPGVLDDAGLARRVSAALRLALGNAHLQAEARARVDELRASRQRLLDAGDAERRRLERRLQAGPQRRLSSVEQMLLRARATVRADAAQVLDEAAGELCRARAELLELGRGLLPAALSERGLAPALTSLAKQAPVPVTVRVDGERLPPDVEAAIFFVCSEALANVAKHAGASRATVDASVGDGWARVEVSDDGRGGADAGRGSGLLGLADRLEALGGRLGLDSPAGEGTRLTAELPMREPAQSRSASVAAASGFSLNVRAPQEKP